jgi:hypothetical protein
VARLNLRSRFNSDDTSCEALNDHRDSLRRYNVSLVYNQPARARYCTFQLGWDLARVCCGVTVRGIYIYAWRTLVLWAAWGGRVA